jgi:hypothetical protein
MAESIWSSSWCQSGRILRCKWCKHFFFLEKRIWNSYNDLIVLLCRKKLNTKREKQREIAGYYIRWLPKKKNQRSRVCCCT